MVVLEITLARSCLSINEKTSDKIATDQKGDGQGSVSDSAIPLSAPAGPTGWQF